MMTIAAQKRHYSYRRVHALFQRGDGYFANHKRIGHLYSRVRMRIVAVERALLPLPIGPNRAG